MAKPKVTLARAGGAPQDRGDAGAASSTPEQIAALFASGVDVFRLNFSHGTQEDHKARLDTIRALEARTGRPIGVMADLQGPKLRLGTFTAGKIALAKVSISLDLDRTPGDQNRAPLPSEIFAALETDAELPSTTATSASRWTPAARISPRPRSMAGSALSTARRQRAGVVLPLSALTPKDRSDLAYA